MMNLSAYKAMKELTRIIYSRNNFLRYFFTHTTRSSENKINNLMEDIPIKNLLDESVIIQKKISEEKEEGKEKRKKVTMSKSSVILFPGQGTQFVGMGKRLIKYPYVKEMYERASEILEYDILKISTEGPDSKLRQTNFQQPAIFLASLAAVEKLQHENPEAVIMCEATAGFSVGEVTALTFAGSISFENAVKLVKIRGEAMQIASELNRTGMITVFYGPDSKLKYACSVAKRYCETIGMEEVDCRVANYLYPDCKVVAGNEEALDFIIKHKEDFKLKRIKRIDVAGAFHTDLMKPAAFAFKEALKCVTISHPKIPVISNVTGSRYKNVTEIKKNLPKQIYSPVRWEQALHCLYERKGDESYPRTFECGPGKSLCSILKMVNAKAHKFCTNVEV